MTPFRVLVVDDSPFMRRIISDLIERDQRFQVAGTASNGREAVVKAKELDPDIITMDVEMPEMNGLDALKTIMETGPRAVIMLSGVNEQGMRETILALEFGAFDFIRKPSISNAQDIEQVGRELLKQLNAAMQAKARRALWEEEEQKRQDNPKAILLPPRPSDRQLFLGSDDQNLPTAPSYHSKKKKDSKEGISEQSLARNPNAIEKAPETPKSKPHQTMDSSGRTAGEKGFTSFVGRRAIEANTSHLVRKGSDVNMVSSADSSGEHSSISQLVAVGCSTGGPRALKAFLENLPGDFPAPIVIVQHMPPNFTKSLAQRLDFFSPLQVVEASDGMELKKGAAYIAPGGSHMRITRSEDDQYRIAIHHDEPRNGHRPSVDVLFESLLPLTSLKRHAVIMTGMGSDGAKMMKRLYDSGVTSTFAESEETCVVYGMPRSAVELGCVSYVLPLHEIAGKLVQAVNIGK
ncbi:protein-glutamate methylesterase/protein-glutamine glutaminase [Paenibacillus faecalis]|uniref:protein-glutamate methylesterase/protein-glutamine glutaminase n=1 Tax=Paenibacillus faecalis TaxID=2079532 RepID=UPI000D112CA9|nr:chemotaxis response regulator protein-glutamate methylesterase [Paenibacillus faecalis]